MFQIQQPQNVVTRIYPASIRKSRKMNKKNFYLFGILLLLTTLSESRVIVPRRLRNFANSGNGEIPYSLNPLGSADKPAFSPGISNKPTAGDDFGVYEYDVQPFEYDYEVPGEVDKKEVTGGPKVNPEKFPSDIDRTEGPLKETDEKDDGIFNILPDNDKFDDDSYESFDDDSKDPFDKGDSKPVEDDDKSIPKDEESHIDTDADEEHKDEDAKNELDEEDNKHAPEDKDRVPKEDEDKEGPKDEESEKHDKDGDDDNSDEDDKYDDKSEDDKDDDKSGDDKDDDKSGDDKDDDKSGDDKDDDKSGDDKDDKSGDDKDDKSGDDKDDDKSRDDKDDDKSGDDEDDKSEHDKDDDEESEEHDKEDEDKDIHSAEDAEPFSGGSIFDTPFFNYERVKNYFGLLDRALEHTFRETLEEAKLLNGTYANTTEEEVDIDGKKYVVQKSVIKSADNHSTIYVETLSTKLNGTDSEGSEVTELKNVTNV